MSPDWVGLIEAIYAVEAPFDHWVEAIVAHARPCAPEGASALGYTYDVSRPGRLQLSRIATAGEASMMAAVTTQMAGVEVPPQFTDATYRSLRAGSQRETLPALTKLFQGMIAQDLSPGLVDATYHGVRGGAPEPEDYVGPSIEQYMAFTGFAELHIANGIDLDGHGCWLGMGLPVFEPLEAWRREALERTAAHLATAWRLRRRLAASSQNVTGRAEAVLAPDGHVTHALGAAREAEAQAALSSAVRAIDHARTRGRRSDPGLGLSEWSGLVAQRWSLVEVVEHDGRRFLVAEENEMARGGTDALSAREREVAMLAALGLSNKLIAYELGITPSTVGVLIHRTLKKLGIEDRESLRARLSEPDAPR